MSAYVVDSLGTDNAGVTTASLVVNLPQHSAGQLLLIYASVVDNNAEITLTGTGWIRKEFINAPLTLASSALFYKIATSNNEALPTVNTSGGVDDLGAQALVIDDFDSANIFNDSTTKVQSVAANTFDLPSLTTTNDNTLVLSFITSEDDFRGWTPTLPLRLVRWHTDLDFLSIACYEEVRQTAGVTPAHTLIHTYTKGEASCISVAINGVGTARASISETVSGMERPCVFPTINTASYNCNGSGTPDVYFGTDTLDGRTVITENLDKRTAHFYPQNNRVSKEYLAQFNNTSSAKGTLRFGSILFDTPKDMSNKIFYTTVGSNFGTSKLPIYSNGGGYIGLSDGTNIAVWKILAVDTQLTPLEGFFGVSIETNTAPYYSSGVVNFSAISEIALGLYFEDQGEFGVQDWLTFNLANDNCLTFVGGTASKPLSFNTLTDYSKSCAFGFLTNQRGVTDSQFTCSVPIQFGESGKPTYVDLTNQVIAFPPAYDEAKKLVHSKINSGSLQFRIKANTGDTFILNSCVIDLSNFHRFVIDPASVDADIYSFKGCTILNADVILQDKPAIDYAGLTISNCKELTTNGADLSGGCTISNCVDTQAITITGADSTALATEFAKLNNCIFSGNNAAIKVVFAGDATLNAVNMKFSNNTVDVEYTGSGTLTIQADANSVIATTNASGGGNIVITAPKKGITFTGTITGAQIVVYAAGTQTERKRFASSTGSDVWETNSNDTVDYTILKAGYRPVKIDAVSITQANTVNIDDLLQVDRAYQSGVVFNYGQAADGYYDAANKVFTTNKVIKVQEFYSCMIDAWIAQTSLRNIKFCITPNGSNSFSFDDCTINPASISKLYRDGVRETVSGTVTRKWAAIWSSGKVGTDIAELQQIAGASPVKGWNTPNQTQGGNVDMLLKVYDSVLSIDYQNYLVIEYAKAGKYQGRVVAHDVYPSIEDDLYVVAVEPKSSPIPASDPALANPPTITIEANPIAWKGKNFSITIKDSAQGNTGADIAQWINWNIREEADSAFQGQDPMNWYDMVVDNATGWETAQGNVLGAVTNAGVRVVLSDGITEHPDFTRHQSNDGTYYVKPVTANISITNLPDDVGGITRLQIKNMTTGVITYSDDPASTAYSASYINGNEYSAGDSIRIRFAHLNGNTSFEYGETFVTASADGFSADGANFIKPEPVYAINKLDGSAFDNVFSPNFASNYIVLDANADFKGVEAFAYYCFVLTGATGIDQFWGGVTAIDESNYRINNDIVNIFFDETLGFVKQLDGVRIFRSDGLRPALDPTTGDNGIEINWRNPVYGYDAGGGGFTASDRATLDGINNKTALNSDMQEVKTALDLDAANPNTYADDGSVIANANFTRTKTDNGNGTFTVNRS